MLGWVGLHFLLYLPRQLQHHSGPEILLFCIYFSNLWYCKISFVSFWSMLIIPTTCFMSRSWSDDTPASSHPHSVSAKRWVFVRSGFIIIHYTYNSRSNSFSMQFNISLWRIWVVAGAGDQPLTVLIQKWGKRGMLCEMETNIYLNISQLYSGVRLCRGPGGWGIGPGWPVGQKTVQV